jgi:hypothetical protein
MEPHVWQQNLIRKAERVDNQRVIRAFLECVAINQLSFIDKSTVILNEGNSIPV